MIRSAILSWLDGAREIVPEVRTDVADILPVGPNDPKGNYRLDNAINYATGLGSSADKGAATRPRTSDYDMTEHEATALWRHGGISRRIVEIVPTHATRKGWTFRDLDGEEILGDEATDQGLTQAVTEAWTWGRLYGGGFIFMDCGDNEDLSTPVIGPVEIQRLTVYDGTQVSPVSWGSASSEYAGVPDAYMVSPHNAVGQVIHASRLLYFRGAKLPPNVRGTTATQHDDPVLQALWASLGQKSTVDSARALLMQEMSVAVLKMAPGKTISTGKDYAAFGLRMRALAKGRSLLSTIILAPGEDYTVVSRPLAGLGDIDEAAQTAICAATGYPQVILFGKAPAGMSSDDAASRRTWAATLGSELDTIVKPQLLKWARLQTGDNDVRVEFAPIDEPTPKELAETRKLNADSDAIYLDRQVLDPAHVAQSRFGGEVYSHEIDPVDMADLVDGETITAEETKLILEGKK